MRNWIIGAAAALAALAAPGVAAAQATGYVGLVYNSSDFGGATDEVESWGGEGAVAFAGSGSIVFEVDAAILSVDDSSGDDEAYAVVGHVYGRNSDHLFGGFVGLSGSDDSETWIAGLEANKYFSMWTLAGALIYGNNDDANSDGWGANVEARVFPTDNFRLNGNIGWASVDGGAGDDDVMILGAGGEFQFPTVPISIAAGYTNFDSDGGDVDTWTLAARWNFGGTTLRDRDRNGASQASVVGLGSAF